MFSRPLARNDGVAGFFVPQREPWVKYQIDFVFAQSRGFQYQSFAIWNFQIGQLASRAG